MAEGNDLVISISYSNGVATVTTDDANVQGFPKTYYAQGKHEPYAYCESVAKSIGRDTGRKVRYEITAINGLPPVPPKSGMLSRHAVPIAILLTSGVICLVLCLFAYSIEATEASRSLYSASSSSYATRQKDESSITDAQREMLEEIELIQPVEVHDESNSSYTVFVGTLENKSDKTHYFIKVKGEFKDDQGNTIDTDWTYACGDEGLRPGESTKFKLSVDRDERITNMRCYTYDFS